MCNYCVEIKLHALFECALYNDIRQTLLTKLAVKYIIYMFYCFTKEEQLKLIPGCNDEILVKDSAKTCHDIFVTQRNNLHQK